MFFYMEATYIRKNYGLSADLARVRVKQVHRPGKRASALARRGSYQNEKEERPQMAVRGEDILPLVTSLLLFPAWLPYGSLSGSHSGISSKEFAWSKELGVYVKDTLPTNRITLAIQLTQLFPRDYLCVHNGSGDVKQEMITVFFKYYLKQ